MAIIDFGGVKERVITRKEFTPAKARSVLKNEVIAVIGYGVQGPAQGLNMKDNGFNVIVGQAPEFKRDWVERARYSYKTYQSLLGLADAPVEYLDSYVVDGGQDDLVPPESSKGRPDFAELQGELLADLLPQHRAFPAGTHSLGAHALRRSTNLMFNLSAYTRLLMSDFRSAGGRIEVTEFTSPGDLARLPQRTLVHSTGYGARALFADDSVVPVRGQLARTPPQEGIRYGLEYRDSYFVPRRDGFVFQVIGADDYYGYGDDSTVADRHEAEHAIQTIQSLFAA